ncbi:hypothetical protein RND81_02G082900 [Saponaria officinalis]|uniref:Uncharacterized protein n=1 Tax=Saponaria officinalis TaxID=3572 RepID=A0AAW1MT68_SAPOF
MIRKYLPVCHIVMLARFQQYLIIFIWILKKKNKTTYKARSEKVYRKLDTGRISISTEILAHQPRAKPSNCPLDGGILREEISNSLVWMVGWLGRNWRERNRGIQVPTTTQIKILPNLEGKQSYRQ